MRERGKSNDLRFQVLYALKLRSVLTGQRRPQQTKGPPRLAGSPPSVLLSTLVSVMRTVAVVWVLAPIIAIVAVVALIPLVTRVVIVAIVAHLVIV